MGLKNVDKQNKNCLKRVNKKLERNQGFILFLLFVGMLSMIPEVSGRMAKFILMIDIETMTLAVRIFLTIVMTFATLPVIKNLKGE